MLPFVPFSPPLAGFSEVYHRCGGRRLPGTVVTGQLDGDGHRVHEALLGGAILPWDVDGGPVVDVVRTIEHLLRPLPDRSNVLDPLTRVADDAAVTDDLGGSATTDAIVEGLHERLAGVT